VLLLLLLLYHLSGIVGGPDEQDKLPDIRNDQHVLLLPPLLLLLPICNCSGAWWPSGWS
jgi:hypothetical protein